jgi:hypothetical protein
MLPTQIPERFYRDDRVHEERVDGPRILALARLEKFPKVPNHLLVESGFPPILIGQGLDERRQCSNELVPCDCSASDEEHEHQRELSFVSPPLPFQALHPGNEMSHGLLLTNIHWHGRITLTTPPDRGAL